MPVSGRSSERWPAVVVVLDPPTQLQLDSDIPNLGKFSACWRVARTVYMGSAPLAKAAHRGLEDRHVKLGCLMHGESPAVYRSDATLNVPARASRHRSKRFWASSMSVISKP